MLDQIQTNMAAPKRKTHGDNATATMPGKMKKMSPSVKTKHKKRKILTKKVKFASDVAYASSEEEMILKDVVVGESGEDDSESSRDVDMNNETAHDNDHEDIKEPGNAGWADAMAKILRSSTPKDKPVLLAKAKMDRDTILLDEEPAPKPELLLEPEAAIEKPTDKLSLEDRRKMDRKLKYEQREKKTQWINMARQKPSITEKDRERALSRIATKGVVQLFNAVKSQQQTINAKLKEVGGSERKRESVMKTVTKGAFLDVLKGKAKSIQVDNELQNLNQKKKQSDEAPTWRILRDDFMLGAKMKDWDKCNEDDDLNDGDDNIT